MSHQESDCPDCGIYHISYSAQKEFSKLRRFEFDGLMQDVSKKGKGSKSCKDPHTKFSILTRPITNEEMDAIVYGGVYGFKVKLTIEVVKDPDPLLKQEQNNSSKDGVQ